MTRALRAAELLRTAILVAILGLAACTRHQTTVVTLLPNPAGPGSIAPNQTATPEGQVVLSWLEPVNDALALRFAILGTQGWSRPQTVVVRRNFDKYAEAPPWVLSLPNRSLLAVWSEQLPQGKAKWPGNYLYASASSDQGETWSQPLIVHSDRSKGEHSFASLAARDERHASIIWLDSRSYETKHGYRLMSAVIADSGAVSDEQTVDDDTCTCCPTALVKTARGFLAAYRHHTPEEIRDIYIVREEPGGWQTPHSVHDDAWHINGCPVNGPALARHEDKVVAAWFSGVEAKASVQVAFSNDGGASFGNTTKIESQQGMDEPIGRPAVALLPSGKALVAWVRRHDGRPQLVAAQARSDGYLEPLQVVAGDTADSLGYPRMQVVGSQILLSWGGAGETKTVYTALLASK